MSAPSQRSSPALRWYVLSIAAAAVVIAAVLSRVCFPFFAFEPDTAAYLFQAKLLAQGAFSAAAPPEFGFSSSPHINIYNGLWFSKYPFGNSLLLAPGVLLGAPWIMPALATGLTLLLFFSVIRELYDARLAALALLLAFISPTTLLMGSTLLSQPASRLCIAAFLYGILEGAEGKSRHPPTLYAALSGFALGYGFNTRPLVALVFGAIGRRVCPLQDRRSPGQKQLHPPGRLSARAGALMVGLFFAWNGSSDRGSVADRPITHCRRAIGWASGCAARATPPSSATSASISRPPTPSPGSGCTPSRASSSIRSAGDRTSQACFFPSDPRHHFPLLALVLIVPLSLLVIPFADRSRCAADLFCGLIFVLTVAALFFQYSDHGTWGSTPVHCSYYSEATLFGIIPLTARGILILYDGARRRIGGAAPLPFAAAGLLLLANTIHSDAVSVGWFKNWDPYYQALPRLVAAANIHDAVVFIPASRNAPLGEYPFKPLDQADVVYFRTGPLPGWGLNAGDWRVVYDKYFSGRSAYVYDKVELKKLDPATGPGLLDEDLAWASPIAAGAARGAASGRCESLRAADRRGRARTGGSR